MSIAEFADLMTQTVTVETSPTLNDYGEAGSYATSTTYDAYIEDRTEQIVRYDGVTVTSRALVILDTAVQLDPTRCRVTMPSGFAPSQPTLVRCDVYRDGLANHHTELWF